MPELETSSHESTINQQSDSSLENSNNKNLGGVFCRACGSNLSKDKAFCPNCGAKQYTAAPSKTVASLLAFFLGAFGAHRFYLRQWWGVFYIFGSIFFISGLISLIETFYFIFMSDEKWHKKYGNQTPGGGLVLIALLAIFPLIAVIGILAAVAIPQYALYISRTEVSASINQLNTLQAQIVTEYQSTGSVESKTFNIISQSDSSLTLFSDLNVNEEGVITLVYGENASSNLKDKSLFLIPESNKAGEISWECVLGTLEAKYAPKDCTD